VLAVEICHLDGLWWLCAGTSTYSPLQLGDHQFQSLRIPTVIGVSLCIAGVCCCLLRIPTAIGMWLINIFPLSVCGLDSSVTLTLMYFMCLLGCPFLILHLFLLFFFPSFSLLKQSGGKLLLKEEFGAALVWKKGWELR
jgi:hypothetical protein